MVESIFLRGLVWLEFMLKDGDGCYLDAILRCCRYALFFLVRAAPEEMLCLQNGRFDDPDRSFTSVKSAWDSVLRNHADLKVPPHAQDYCYNSRYGFGVQQISQE